jgi:cell wall assembly regulator SMI1
LPVVIILHAGQACRAGRTWPDRTAGVTAPAIRPPADAALLTHAEQATSGSWPEELRTWYTLADGTQRTPAG